MQQTCAQEDEMGTTWSILDAGSAGQVLCPPGTGVGIVEGDPMPCLIFRPPGLGGRIMTASKVAERPVL